MKTLVTTILLILLSTIGKAQNPKTEVIMHLSPEVTQEEQWVYATGWAVVEAEKLDYVILDSTLITKGAKQAKLSFYVKESLTVKILFMKNGPVNLYFSSTPGTKSELTIDENTKDGWYKLPIEGNDMHNEQRLFQRKKEDIRKKIADPTIHKDSVEYYKKYLDKFCINEIYKTKYPRLAELYTVWLPEYSRENEDKEPFRTILHYLKNKFPDAYCIKRLCRTDSSSSNQHYKIGQNHYYTLLKQRLYVEPKDTTMGAKLQLAFPHISKKKINTDSIAEEYVLVDFWASWCVPCRKETPFLKMAKERYKDKLAIYAVTIDADTLKWEKAIEEDSTRHFIHVRGVNDRNVPDKQVRALKIKSIPRNFLLDKERRIIAKDLRGEELLNALEQLINQK